MRKLLFLLVLLTAVTVQAAETPEDSLGWLRRTIRGFSKIDTNYVEPQHYEFSAMLQTTYTYDIYQLKSDDGQRITFAPSPAMKVGPYFGWRWVFAGYTFDLKNLSLGGKSPKQELEFSFYAAQVGIDLFYRRTGSDYKIRDVRMGDYSLQKKLEGLPFDGLSVGITGFNLYYIFNHQRFSYPAAFSQSTCQKISCGSWMAGIGYAYNKLEFDHKKLQDMVSRYGLSEMQLDSGLMFNNVRYLDYSVTGGYAYNWVFARDWLFCASASVGIGYKHTKGDVEFESGFNFNNLSFDGIGRFGLVYNNMRWYAGTSLVLHGYTYHKERFSANNVFGNWNIYVGYNFGLKKKYRNRK